MINHMRHRIKILKKKEEENEFGEKTFSYVYYSKLLAKKQLLSNQTGIAAGKEKTTEKYKFTIRLNKKIKPDMKLEYLGERYDITHVNHIVELGQLETQIICVKKEDVGDDG